MPISDNGLYRFFHPPRCPGAPPLERGEGPNSGPDWRESVGWKILLPLPVPVSSSEGLRGRRAVGTVGQGFRAVHFVEMGFVDAGGDEAPLVDRSPHPARLRRATSPLQGRGRRGTARGVLLPPRFFSEPAGRFAASPYFFVPA